MINAVIANTIKRVQVAAQPEDFYIRKTAIIITKILPNAFSLKMVGMIKLTKS